MNIDFTNVPKHLATRSHEAMQKVLMSPDAVGPANHYYMIRGGKDQRNITVWEPGTVDGEYIKTFGHYHIGDLDETYWLIYGQGIVLLQTLAKDGQGELIADVVEEFKAIPVKQGDDVYIASGQGHLVVNTGTTYMVTADDSPVDFEERDPVSLPGHADYALVEKMRGFAYYVVENEGKPALVKNALYKKVRQQDLGGLEVIDR